MQVVGFGIVAAALWRSIRNQSLGGHITAEIVKFAWRSELHTRYGLIVLVAGSLVYATGTVVMARPYISRPVALFVAVPVAAVAGLLLLGVLALIMTVLFVALANGDLPIDFDLPERWQRKRRRTPS